MLFSLANLACILIFSHWETIPFHFIWISLTLLYGFRVWATRPTLWVLGVVMVTTFAAIGWDVYIGAQSVDELNEVPLMAAMFWMMVWHAQRRLDADPNVTGSATRTPGCWPPSAGSCRTPRTSCGRRSRSRWATPSCWPAS